jgi:hypothetical protein
LVDRGIAKRQNCGCLAWSAVDEVEVYRRVRRMPPGSSYLYRKYRDKTLGQLNAQYLYQIRKEEKFEE